MYTYSGAPKVLQKIVETLLCHHGFLLWKVLGKKSVFHAFVIILASHQVPLHQDDGVARHCSDERLTLSFEFHCKNSTPPRILQILWGI